MALDLGDLAFAYAALDGTVWLAADGRVRQVISESLLAGPDFAVPAGNVKWSPDGRRLAYREPSLPSGPPTGSELWVLDLSSGDRIRLDDAVLDFNWMKNGKRIYYQRAPSESWIADLSSGAKTKIGDNRVWWSHDETRFVFTGRIGEYDPARPWESIALFLGTADGAPSRRLIDWAGASDWLGPWSPDDRLLAYYKEEHGGSALVGDICTWDLSTSKEICLGQFTSDEFPDWASVRGRYVFHNYEIDPAKGTVGELFPRPGALIGWSPDAAKVAYVEGSAFGQGPRSLIILDVAAGSRLTLHTSNASTSHAASPGYWARWSPDGRFLAFIGLDDEGAAALYVADSSTGDAVLVRKDFAVGELFFSYSLDSTHLLIQVGRYGSPSIWIAEGNGANPVKLADGYAIGHGPEFAPWRP